MNPTDTTWRASGPYIFEGKNCIGIFDTDVVPESLMAERAWRAASAVNAHDVLVAACQSVVDTCTSAPPTQLVHRLGEAADICAKALQLARQP